MDRIKSALARMVKTFAARLDYLALYPARVVSMDVGAQTVEIKPDDERVPDLADVPLRHGLPGIEVEVESGARVLLGFEGGDPTRPFAMLWQGETLKSLTIRAAGETKIECQSATIESSGDVAIQCVNSNLEARGTATVKGTMVQLGAGAVGVAYQGSAVQAGPYAGTVTLGSTTVTTGV